MSSPEGEAQAWAAVRSQLDHHRRQPAHTWLDTLNRLWRKNRFVIGIDGLVKLPEPPPLLTEDMLSVSAERWPLARLVPLVHPDAHDRARPKQDGLPILLLEWRGRHFLIDGINRINRRKREGDAGPHDVIVIHARQPQALDSRRMAYALTIHEKPSYLHAVVTGSNSLENVKSYLEDLRRECENRRCYRVLIEERLTGGRLGTWDVYQIASENSALARGFFNAVAYVDVNAHGELMKFAEVVANNRGVPMTVFSTVAEAERWITAPPN